MSKKEESKLIRRQEHIITTLTDDQDEYLDMLEEFYDISIQLNKLKITNDDTRDIAIRCVDSMFEHNLLDMNDEFKIQDIIHNEINKALKIKEDR